MKIELVPGINLQKVRCHVVALHIVRNIRHGGFYRQELIIDDSRFIPRPYDEALSKVSPGLNKRLIIWATGIWPEWKMKEFSLFTTISWLEALTQVDQAMVIQILQEYYGLPPIQFIKR